MDGVKPIKHIKKWRNDGEIIEFCEQIILDRDKYYPERVFEAREVLNELKQKQVTSK